VEQKPARTLKDSQSALSNLRILSHPIDSDWLLGAGFSPGAGSTFQGTGFSYFYLWSEPSAGASSASQITATGATEVRGLAIGAGSN